MEMVGHEAIGNKLNSFLVIAGLAGGSVNDFICI